MIHAGFFFFLHLMAEFISLFTYPPLHFECDVAFLYKTAITRVRTSRRGNVTTLDLARLAKQ